MLAAVWSTLKHGQGRRYQSHQDGRSPQTTIVNIINGAITRPRMFVQ
jgi:hypothetical protein